MRPSFITEKHYLDAEHKLRREFYGFNIDIDDIVQEGLIAFFNASLTIDPNNKGFFTFCYNKAKWRVLDYLRKIKVYNLGGVHLDDIENSENSISHNDGLAVAIADRELNKLSSYHSDIIIKTLLTDDDTKLPSSTVRRVKKQFKEQLEKSLN